MHTYKEKKNNDECRVVKGWGTGDNGKRPALLELRDRTGCELTRQMMISGGSAIQPTQIFFILFSLLLLTSQ